MRWFFCIVAALGVASAQKSTDVAQVAKSPAKFDHQVLTLTGKVAHFVQRTSRSGNPYFLFKLDGKGGGEVSVYGHGEIKPSLKDGKNVRLVGRFAKERHVGERTYKNEIEVTQGKDKKPMVTIFR